MTKEKRLLKKLYVTVGGALGIVIANAVLAVFLVNYMEEMQNSERTLTTQKQSIEQQHRTLLEQREKAENSLSLYQKLAGGDEGSVFSLDKKILTDLLNRLNKRYELKELSLTISPIREETSDGFQKKTGTIIISDIEITFRSITDEYALAFLQRFFSEFSGFVNITEFKLTKDENINAETLYAARTKEAPPLVKGKVSFNWLGLKIHEEEKPQP